MNTIFSALLLVAAASAAPPAASISAPELRERLSLKEPQLLIDCRPKREYAEGHIAGAVSIPLFVIGFEPLPRDRDLVLYCGGRSCSLSARAAKKLQALGYTRVLALSGGLADWESRGYPMTRSEKFNSVVKERPPL